MSKKGTSYVTMDDYHHNCEKCGQTIPKGQIAEFHSDGKGGHSWSHTNGECVASSTAVSGAEGDFSGQSK